MWSDILLILVSALGAIYISFSLDEKHKDVKNVLILSLTSIVFYQINLFLNYEYISVVNEILLLIIFTSLLSFLLLTIRKLKPQFARYPYAIVFFPLFIILLYPLIIGETSIIYLVLQLLQSAALLALLFIVLSHMDQRNLKLFGMLIFLLLLSSGIIYWSGEMINFNKWLWQTLAAISIGLGSYIISQFFNHDETIKAYEPRP